MHITPLIYCTFFCQPEVLLGYGGREVHSDFVSAPPDSRLCNTGLRTSRVHPQICTLESQTLDSGLCVYAPGLRTLQSRTLDFACTFPDCVLFNPRLRTSHVHPWTPHSSILDLSVVLPVCVLIKFDRDTGIIKLYQKKRVPLQCRRAPLTLHRLRALNCTH